VSKELETCAQCADFLAARDFRECKKIDNVIARIMALIFRSNRPAALALLRDQGIDAYLVSKRTTGKM
jgi:hypothetical protein